MSAIDSILVDGSNVNKASLRSFLANPEFDTVRVGTYVEDGSDPGYIAKRSLTGVSDGSGHGFQDDTTINKGSGEFQYNSFFARGTFTGTKNYNHLRGFQSYITSNTTGTVDEMQSLISYPIVTLGVITDLNHVEIGATAISAGGQVWHEVGLKIIGTPAATVDASPIYSTWDWPSYLYGGLGFANNRYLAGKDAAGTLRNMLGIDGSDDMYIATSGLAGRIYVMRPLFTIASAAGNAGFRIPHGSAPTSPVNGDMWSTTTTLNFRLNGVTKSITMT